MFLDLLKDGIMEPWGKSVTMWVSCRYRMAIVTNSFVDVGYIWVKICNEWKHDPVFLM